MKPYLLLAAAALTASASAHRLDEYLQASILSLSKDHVQLSIVLMPGVAVYERAVAPIDLDHNGTISPAEQRAYGIRVLRDLSISLDGTLLTPKLTAFKFSQVAEMKKGLGYIELKFQAPIPNGGPTRKLVFNNHHQPKIAAYQANCLVPNDPKIQVTTQDRNPNQSHYEITYKTA